MRDQASGAITRVSFEPDGEQLGYHASDPRLSGDGRLVGFTIGSDVYLHDRDTDRDGQFDEPGAAETVILYPETIGGDPIKPGGFNCALPTTISISRDGRFVVFSSCYTKSGHPIIRVRCVCLQYTDPPDDSGGEWFLPGCFRRWPLYRLQWLHRQCSSQGRPIPMQTQVYVLGPRPGRGPDL